MNNDQRVEEHLTRLGNEWPLGASIVESVMRRIEMPLTGPARGPGNSRWAGSALVGAATVVCLLAVWLAGTGAFNSATLSAQMRDALLRARTAHVVETVPDDGAHKVVGEFWYRRGVGYRDERNGIVRGDNGRSRWVHVRGTALVVQSASQNVSDEIGRMMAFVPPDDEPVRAPERDSEINGVMCRAYVVTLPDRIQGEGANLRRIETRIVFLLDDSQRVHRVERQEHVDDTWRIRRTMQVAYDLDVPASRFDPDFGPETEIVDADAALDKKFGLDTALYTAEHEGLVFAVHELKRLQDGMIFGVTSVRGTEETLRRFPPRRHMFQPGRFVEGTIGHQQFGPLGQDHQFEIAAARHRGVQFHWWVMAPRATPRGNGDFEPERGRIQLDNITLFHSDPRRTAPERLRRDRVQEPIRVSATIDLPIEAPVALNEQSRRVHSDAAFLEELDVSAYLYIQEETNGTVVIQPTRPRDVSAEEFSGHVLTLVEYWMSRD